MPGVPVDVSRETSRPLPLWAEVRRADLERFEEILATTGVERGLIGPREVPRLWERHVLNCLVVADPAITLVPEGSTVADVGSGAGLPGVVWSIARPDITMVLVEPLLRRSTFLTEVIDEFGIGEHASVVRARAEELIRTSGWQGVDIVTARAVAPLERLLGWTVPLLRPGGHLVALKGLSASEEIEAAQVVADQVGITGLRVMSVGGEILDPATSVVVGERRTAQ